MKSPRLHILMPCSRSHQIATLAPHFLIYPEPHPFEVRWHILQQGPEPDPKGIYKVNELIDMIPKDPRHWFVTWSDDTYHHPALYRRLGETISANPTCRAIVFSEQRPDGSILVAEPKNMEEGFVDGSQVAFNRELIGDHRYNWNQYLGRCDGRFIEDRYKESPRSFVFVNEVLCNWNRLEWKHENAC